VVGIPVQNGDPPGAARPRVGGGDRSVVEQTEAHRPRMLGMVTRRPAGAERIPQAPFEHLLDRGHGGPRGVDSSLEADGVQRRVGIEAAASRLRDRPPVRSLTETLTGRDFPAVLSQRPDTLLAYVGEGREQAVMTARAQALGCLANVRFAGAVAHADLPHWFRAASVLCLPSHNEGVPNVVLEAMACGTPVITSSSSSLPEVGGDAAILVDPYDAIDLSDAMYRVLANASFREELRERGLKWVGGFSWRRTAEQMSRLLDDVRSGRIDQVPRG